MFYESLITRGYHAEPTASVQLSELTFKAYCDSDIQLFYHPELKIYMLGDIKGHEIMQAGTTQEEASATIEEFFKEIIQDEDN